MKKFIFIQFLIILSTAIFTSFLCNQIYKKKLNEIKTDIDIHYKIALIHRDETSKDLEKLLSTVRENLKDDEYFMNLFNHNIKILEDLDKYNIKKLYLMPIFEGTTFDDIKLKILDDITLLYCISKENENKSCKMIFDTLYNEHYEFIRSRP